MAQPCVPRSPWTSRDLLYRLITLHQDGATPEQWQSLAIDLGRQVAEQQVRLDRLAAIESRLTALADTYQYGATLDAIARDLP